MTDKKLQIPSTNLQECSKLQTSKVGVADANSLARTWNTMAPGGHFPFPFGRGEGQGENSPKPSSRFEPRNHGAPPLPACGHPLLHSEWRRGPGRGGAPVHGEGKFRSDSIAIARSFPLTPTLSPSAGERETVLGGGCVHRASRDFAVHGRRVLDWRGHQIFSLTSSLHSVREQNRWMSLASCRNYNHRRLPVTKPSRSRAPC